MYVSSAEFGNFLWCPIARLCLQVYVKMVDLETDHEYSWTKERFLNRKYVMQEMFENYTDGEAWQLPAVSAPDRHSFVLNNADQQEAHDCAQQFPVCNS